MIGVDIKPLNYAASIFVKTPGLSPLKTRLAEGTNQKVAENIHYQSALSVYSILKQNSAIEITWSIAEEDEKAHRFWPGATFYQGGGDLANKLYQTQEYLSY